MNRASLGASVGALSSTTPRLEDREFRRVRDLVLGYAGIHLAESKRALVIARLSGRLRDLGLASYRDYLAHVDASGAGELQELINRICTNETSFFRDPRQFDHLASHVVPQLLAGRPRPLRMWSAACSTGEEPYSIAMTVLERLSTMLGWDVEVTATDLSTRALERARRAIWPLAQAPKIPRRLLRAFMLRGTGDHEGEMSAGPEIRRVVQVGQVNLNGDAWPAGPFDVIFCRNVLIYFGREERERVLAGLIERLAPGGHLFLGLAETLAGVGLGMRAVAPGVYVSRREAPAE